MLVFHNFHSTTIFLIPQPPCKYPNARYNLRSPVTNYFPARHVRQILLQGSENSFRPNYRYMLQTLCKTMEVANLAPIFTEKWTLATFGRQGLIVVYVLTRSVETSQPILTTLPTAQYIFMDIFFANFVRIDFKTLK